MAELTERIATLFSQAGVKASYGEAVELDGTTLIPVAATWHGFGAGESDGKEDSEGSGGGGGGVSLPVGAYVSRNGDTRFEPNIIALMAVAVPLVCVTGRAIGRILRGFRGRR